MIGGCGPLHIFRSMVSVENGSGAEPSRIMSDSSKELQTGKELSIGSENKRRSEFHQTFRSIPEDEVLIETYACALSRDILIQGRLYLGAEHLCFYANIFGWITSVVVGIRDIVAIEKRNTAVIFPNAIQISTLHHKYFFASFVYREDAYKQIILAWKRAVSPDKTSISAGPNAVEKGDHTDLFSDDVLMQPKLEEYQADISDPKHRLVESRSLCGCKLHFSIEALLLLVPMPISSIHSTLFDSKNDFIKSFLESVGMKECFIGEWRVLLSGGEQREIQMQMSLPRILSGNGMAKVRMTEKYLLFQPGRKFVVEITMEIKDVPGGTCRILSRLCLAAVDSRQSHILVTFDAFPPSGSFFRESIRQSLSIHLSEFYAAFGVAVLHYSSATTDVARIPPRTLSWFRRHPRNRSGDLHRSTSSTFQSYFDKKAFIQSLYWTLPVLVILFAWMIFSNGIQRPFFRKDAGLPLQERTKLAQNIKMQLASYLQREGIIKADWELDSSNS